MFARLLVLIAVCLSLQAVACAKVDYSDIQTQAKVDPDADLSRLKSFAWLGGMSVLEDPQGYWVESGLDLNEEVQGFIKNELRKKGFTETLNSPDAFVSFLIVNEVHELLELQRSRGSQMPTLVGIGQGALLIELVDAKSGRTLWIGAAVADTQSNRSESAVRARIEHAVKSIFEEMPR
ncbi:MAG: DUF4136 domain-containing protein [Polyangiaceae bacterium]|nr:DUF4136 domain-containing protein [Polyangiaceae bacterium]